MLLDFGTLTPIQKMPSYLFAITLKGTAADIRGFLIVNKTSVKKNLYVVLTLFALIHMQKIFLEAVCNGENDEYIKTDYVFLILILVLPIL